jgi:hypothetical protein
MRGNLRAWSFFVTARLQVILFAIVVAAAAVDVAWVRAGGFDVDTTAYSSLALLFLVLAGGAVFYEHYRRDAKLAAMLTGTAFLIGMSAAFSVMNYLLLTVAGHRIDANLAAIDRAMGVDWPAMMAFVSHYPVTNFVLKVLYLSVLPQVAAVTVAQGLIGKPERIYGLCLSVSAGAAMCIVTWTLLPAFGAFSVYDVSSLHMSLALDTNYARALTSLLAHGPGHISPTDAKGLIGFPSYHGTLAILVAWYARDLKVVRWFAFGINAVVIVATPIQGGHHVIDVIAGFAVAALAIAFANWVMALAARAGAPAALTAQTANP